MRKKDIVENLQLMHGLRLGGEPSPAWVAETRDVLLARVAADAAAAGEPKRSIGQVFGIVGFKDVFGAAFRYGGVLAATVILVLGSGIVGASAMYDSVPGDTLYPLKRATERAQVALTLSADARAKLQVDLMGRRVDEIAKIADQSGDDSQAGRMAMAVSELRQEATNVESEMTSLKKDSPSSAVELAKYIDKKADQYHVALKSPSPAPGVGAAFAPADDGLSEARDIVVDASVKAVAVMIEGNTSGDAPISQWEVASTVGDKIKAMSDRVDSIEGDLSTSTPSSVKESADQAKAALDEAQKLVDKSDLAGALVKVIESKELVQAAETIANASDVAAATVASGTVVTAPPVKLEPGMVMTGLATSSYPFEVEATTTDRGDAASATIQETSIP